MLEMKDLYVSYGMMEVIHGIDLKIDSGELVPVIRSNDAGETTLIKATMGLVSLHSGSVLCNRQDTLAPPTHKRVETGIGYVPGGRRVFGDLMAKENLRIGAYRLPDAKQIRPNLQKVYEVLPRLGERKNQLVHTMSDGEQQMPAIGRALISSPRLLLIDKVSTGLMPIMVNTCFQIIKKLNESGIMILVVEQNVNKVLEIANRGCAVGTSNITLEGASEVLRSNDMVQKAY